MTVLEAENITDFEKLKEVFKKLKTSDVIPIVIASIDTFKSVGEFTESLGKLEKKDKELFDILYQLSQQTPEMLLLSIIDKIPEDKLKSMIEWSLKLTTMQNKLNNFNKLSADEKISLGRDMKEISTKLIEIISELPQ